jgi:hypothetical protein
VYRVVRRPLASFDVADVSRGDLSGARSSITAARDALATFSEAVGDPPERYRSLPALVTVHERLLDALSAAVDLRSSLAGLDGFSGDDPDSRLEPLRSLVSRLATAASDLRGVAESGPTVPPSLFLTIERLRSFASTLDAQSTAIDRLLDATARELAAEVDWRAGREAFDRDAFDDARTNFESALGQYRDAADLVDDADVVGSFADLAERRACAARAGVEASSTARRAAEAAATGDDDRAARLMEAAEATRTRCDD